MKSLTTFILLTDPQLGWIPPDRQLPALNNLNKALNDIHTIPFPENNGTIPIDLFNCSGLIGKPDAVFFAGDLTNYGGQMNFWDWSFNMGVYSQGGELLKQFRQLYDPTYTIYVNNTPEFEHLSNCGPLYFGLGNHDILWDFDKDLPWADFDGNKNTAYKDYYRYQMWNFISTMHTGYHRKLQGYDVNMTAPYPIAADNIDSDPLGTFYYQKYSFNYVVDLGPVDVYQLHMYGGDVGHDRKSGLEWLKRKLAAGGYKRPVFIIQHYPITSMPPRRRKDLLNILRPYNVIGIGVGHLHGPVKVYNAGEEGTTCGVSSDHQMNEIHPGGCLIDDNYKDFLGKTKPDNTTGARFAVVRVEQPASGSEVITNVLYGTVKENTTYIQWQYGSHSSSSFHEMYVQDIEVVHLDDKVNDASSLLPWYVREESEKSANINEGFAGKYVYIRPLLTKDPAEACTGFELLIQDDEYEAPTTLNKDLAGEASGKHRYLMPKRQKGKKPVHQLFLWRPDGKQAPKIGWELSPDLNEGRGGDPLYLEWDVGCDT